MKKQFDYITDRNGFILPYVLFITALVIITVTASIQLYQNELKINEHQKEQLKIETLFQMGYGKFSEDILSKNKPVNPITYHFPYGNVEIKYKKINNEEYHLYFTMTTNYQKIVSLPHRLITNSE